MSGWADDGRMARVGGSCCPGFSLVTIGMEKPYSEHDLKHLQLVIKSPRTCMLVAASRVSAAPAAACAGVGATTAGFRAVTLPPAALLKAVVLLELARGAEEDDPNMSDRNCCASGFCASTPLSGALQCCQATSPEVSKAIAITGPASAVALAGTGRARLRNLRSTVARAIAAWKQLLWTSSDQVMVAHVSDYQASHWLISAQVRIWAHGHPSSVSTNG